MSIEGFKTAIDDAKTAMVKLNDLDILPGMAEIHQAGWLAIAAQAQIAQAEILEAIHQRLMNLALKGDK